MRYFRFQIKFFNWRGWPISKMIESYCLWENRVMCPAIGLNKTFLYHWTVFLCFLILVLICLQFLFRDLLYRFCISLFGWIKIKSESSKKRKGTRKKRRRGHIKECQVHLRTCRAHGWMFKVSSQKRIFGFRDQGGFRHNFFLCRE